MTAWNTLPKLTELGLDSNELNQTPHWSITKPSTPYPRSLTQATSRENDKGASSAETIAGKSKGEFVMADNATWNKCDVCGKFISMENFYTGKATRTMVTPDSEFSTEDYETLCPLHNDNNLRKPT